jgi:hypothetical protein
MLGQPPVEPEPEPEPEWKQPTLSDQQLPQRHSVELSNNSRTVIEVMPAAGESDDDEGQGLTDGSVHA